MIEHILFIMMILSGVIMLRALEPAKEMIKWRIFHSGKDGC
jgi:hypothetical protein